MLAALFLAAVLSFETCATCTSTGREVKLCDPHALEERTTLDRERNRLKSDRSAEVVAALEAVAALTQPHSNAPSPKVAQALAGALEHELLTVRRRAAELLGPPQHGLVGLNALVSALEDTQKEAARLRGQAKSLDAQLEGKLPDKRREALTAERKTCELQGRELSEWRSTLTARLTVFPDDRAVNAILDHTHRNLILHSDTALVRLGNKKAVRALKESIDKGDENMADVEKELAERQAARKGDTVTLGQALEVRVVEGMRESLVKSRRELMAAFAERGLTTPAPEATSKDWKKWIDENLGAFPDSLPGVQGAAW